MSNDYAKGFKEGFVVGLEEGKKLWPSATKENNRSVYGMTGAVGSTSTVEYPMGMNGPSDYSFYGPFGSIMSNGLDDYSR